MPVSNDIFELVRSMSRKEKSFFRRYSRMNSAGKEGAMNALFERLVEYSSAHNNYDEAVLKRGLDKNTLKHFPVIKNNLYGLILKSLIEFSDENTIEDKVKNMIEQHDLLFSKSLLKQSRNVLMKAKRYAEESELFLQLYIILNKERILARYMMDAGSYERIVESVHSEQTIILEKVKNLMEMNDLGSRVTLMLQKYPTSLVRDEAALKEVNAVLDHPLLKDETKMLSGTTLKRFYNINVVVSQWRKENRSALEFAKKYADEVEKDADRNRSTVHDYIISLNSLITASTRTGDMAEFENAYEKFSGINKRFASISERDRLEAFYFLGLTVFSASADNYRPERGEEMLIKAEENFRQYEKELSVQQKIVWYFIIARFCFSKKNYHEAGKWLNRLISIPNIDLSQDYQCYGRIMNVVVAYETGNPDSIEHALRMAYYFLTKRNKVYRYEKIILDYIRQSFRLRSQREINEMLVFMRRDLKAISDDPFEENAFDAFNISDGWKER